MAPLRPVRRTPAPFALALLVVLLAVLLGGEAAGPLFAALRRTQGEKVQVTGVVSDKEGKPLSNLRVVLEASRSYFSFRDLRRDEKDVRKVSAMTDAQGQYTLVWPWDSYFNRFDLVVGVPVRKQGGEQVAELARQDITERMKGGNPVVATLAVENTRFLDNLRAFVASVQSADEHRVYGEMGKPDEVKRVQYPDDLEASWWYFEIGKVYRFRDGHLEQVVPFDPVKGSDRHPMRPDLVQNQPLVDAQENHRSALASRFMELVADKLVATEAVFRHHLDADVPFIHQAGDYITRGGGKRVRPALLLLSARLLGHDGEEEVTYAAVVEFIDTATLIHDDVIDHAGLRRGQATLNQLWGNNLTVLLGDWIYTKAMQMALSHGQVEVIQRLCGATLKMTEGELLAFQRLGAIDLTAEEYFGIIDRKTAHLFAASCSIPALIPPQRTEAGQVLARYGRALGTCFQLVDDLLDFTARESELGKPVLSDLKEGKLTLPLILLLPRVTPAERRRIETVLEDRSFARVSPQEILDLVRAEGTLEEVEGMAEDYAAQAKRELEIFPPGDARDALEFAPDFVLHRRS